MSAASNAVCRDPARAFAFERLTFSFLRDDPLVRGTCKVCGATDVPVSAKAPGGLGACAAQLALVQKRHTAAEGHPIEHGAPLHQPHKRGYFALADVFMSLLASDAQSLVTAKVVPTRPLPPNAAIRRGTTFAEVLDVVTTRDLAPFVLCEFNQLADMPMAISRSNAEILVNGRRAVVRLDRERLRSLVALIEEHGDKPLAEASEVRRLAGGSDRKAAADAMARLVRRHPALAALLRTRPATVPNGDENELSYARTIVASRRRVRDREQAPPVGQGAIP